MEGCNWQASLHHIYRKVRTIVHKLLFAKKQANKKSCTLALGKDYSPPYIKEETLSKIVSALDLKAFEFNYSFMRQAWITERGVWWT
jgi:hypothetical protein